MPEQAPVDWMIDGFSSALARLLDATQQADSDGRKTFVPLFEALNWAASIDLFYIDAGNPIGHDLLTGVRFARNRVHHQWAKALKRYTPEPPRIYLAARPHGGSFRRQARPQGLYWYWLNATELPAGRADKAGEAAYQEELAEKLAYETLEGLQPVLQSL